MVYKFQTRAERVVEELKENDLGVNGMGWIGEPSMMEHFLVAGGKVERVGAPKMPGVVGLGGAEARATIGGRVPVGAVTTGGVGTGAQGAALGAGGTGASGVPTGWERWRSKSSQQKMSTNALGGRRM